MTIQSRYVAVAATLLTLTFSATSSQAQQPAPQFPNMTFFITSVGGPQGANFGGLEGADRHCQTLAAKAGAGSKTWRAYLSTQAVGGATAVNARDRIGKGPWVNPNGVQIAASVEDLHSANNKLTAETSVAENGKLIPSRLYTVNQHDILTGTQADGTAFPPDKDMTCGNWTKNGEGSAMVGHTDRMGLRDDAPSKSWNTSHPSRGCDLPALVTTGGVGLLYCFAAN
ncbi:lectin [Reyranella sp.]|uniref:lectin n=1 Tax=Reyranella sp. TaxID=1929291 RepID=UPI003C7AC8B8